MIKVFSTPGDPSLAISQALAQVRSDAFVLLHGTTVGTNTLLQRKGARVAFVTTAGFEDTIEIGRQNRPKLYDLNFERVPPLVNRDLRFGVLERVGPDGSISQRPSPEHLRSLAQAIRGSGADAIAISTLFSFANPENERAIARILEELGPPLSVSHAILPEFREYERASTVVVNAYLQPVMQGYLQRLNSRARTPTSSRTRASRVFVMQSNGGITSVESASQQPVRTLLSGPAGGVVGAAAMARLSGFQRIITFDMGGTSTDVALIDGELKPSSEAEIAGLPVRVPMLDIHTVGAGGGSLARFDAGGALRVGPESAGADPGPICYGRGTQPTVTDADLLLGRLQPDKFLSGSFVLDLDRTRHITAAWLRQQASRLSLEQFAEGVIRVVNANMERSLRVVSVERGHDPRDFALVAFGGAGGLHACELARGLGIPKVIVPSMPGALSAYGILASDIVRDYSRTVMLSLAGKVPMATIRSEFGALEQQARRDFRKEGWEGHPRFQRSLDLRYRGQGFELNVPFTADFTTAFQRQHRLRYGYDHRGREVELVTMRVRATLSAPRIPDRLAMSDSEPAARAEMRKIWWGGRAVPTAIYERAALISKRPYRGPAMVTEASATALFPAGVTFTSDRAGNLIVSL